LQPLLQPWPNPGRVSPWKKASDTHYARRKVEVFAKMPGNAAQLAMMEKRAKPITKGLVICVENEGKLRYLTNPVQDAEHDRR